LREASRRTCTGICAADGSWSWWHWLSGWWNLSAGTWQQLSGLRVRWCTGAVAAEAQIAPAAPRTSQPQHSAVVCRSRSRHGSSDQQVSTYLVPLLAGCSPATAAAAAAAAVVQANSMLPTTLSLPAAVKHEPGYCGDASPVAVLVSGMQATKQQQPQY
jgi:hypothetical protein